MLIKSRLTTLMGLGILAFLGALWSFDPTPVAAITGVNDFLEVEWVELGQEAWYPTSSGISEGQSIVVNGKLYVFGGYEQCCIPIRKAYVFDPISERWTPLADMPMGTTHTGIATDGTDIYLAGGYQETPDGTYRIPGYEKFWRYNVATDTYTAMPDLPIKASTGQLAYLNGKLHYIGGTTPVSQVADLPDHYVFDLDAYKANPTDTTIDWVDITATAGLPNPRQHAGIAVVDGKIYYVGGQHLHNDSLVPQDDVHRYDPVTNTWEQMADMPAPRNHMSNTIVVLNGRIITFAGQSEHETSHDEIYLYDPSTNTWSTVGTVPRAQHSAIAGLIDNTLYYGTGDKGYQDNERRKMRKGILTLNQPVPTATPTQKPPTPSIPAELLQDGDFEAQDSNLDRLPDAWKVKAVSGDKLKCNNERRSFANSGQCAFMFKGDVGENTRLVQNVNAASRLMNVGDVFKISFYADARSDLVDAVVRVNIRFSDGTSRVKKDLPIPAIQGYQLVENSFTLPSASIASFKIVVRHKTQQGKLFVDDISLKLQPQNMPVLPLP